MSNESMDMDRLEALEHALRTGSQILWDHDSEACEGKPFRLIEHGGQCSWYWSLREMADALILERSKDRDLHVKRMLALDWALRSGVRIEYDFDVDYRDAKPYRTIEPHGDCSWYSSIWDLADGLIDSKEGK